MTGYEAGDRVRLVVCTDPFTTLQPGTKGTVTFTDSSGTIHIHWDNGHQLGVIPEAGDVIEHVADDGPHATPAPGIDIVDATEAARQLARDFCAQHEPEDNHREGQK